MVAALWFTLSCPQCKPQHHFIASLSCQGHSLRVSQLGSHLPFLWRCEEVHFLRADCHWQFLRTKDFSAPYYKEASEYLSIRVTCLKEKKERKRKKKQQQQQKNNYNKNNTTICTSAQNLLCVNVRSALNIGIHTWMGVETPCEPVPPHDVSRVYFEVVVAGGYKKKNWSGTQHFLANVTGLWC